MAQIAACPDLKVLQGITSGQMSVVDAETVIGHVETCPHCLAKVQSLSAADSLEQALSQATAFPAKQDGEAITRLIGKLKKLIASPPASASLSFVCTQCGQTLKTKAELAGKKVKCPKCAQVVAIPETTIGPAKPHISEEATMPPSEATSPSIKAGPGDNTEAGNAASDDEAWDFLAPAQAPDEIGRLGQYRILQVLGRGGMGVVFRAEDPGLKRIVAIKAMLPSLAASPSAKKRFLREAQTAASIKHDHIVTIFQVGEDRGAPFLAMEFLHGEPLDVRLKREGKLPLAEVLRIGREVAEGLAAAHDAGLIHRDIKPANVWLEDRGQGSGVRGQEEREQRTEVGGQRKQGSSSLTPDPCPLTPPRVKILDFGLARATDDQAGLTQSGVIIGTPSYMAPEQARGGKVDGRCDLFSLGCMLYSMATGNPPFRGEDTISTLMSVATDEPPMPSLVNPEIPQELSDLIQSLLAKSPEARPQNAREVALALKAMQSDLLEENRTEVIRKPDLKTKQKTAGAHTAHLAPVGRGQRSRVLLTVAAAVLLLLGGVAIFAGGTIFRFVTDKGLLVIEVDDPNVEVVIKKEGVVVQDRTTKREITINPGDGELEVFEKDGLKLTMKTFSLKRGGKTTVTVSLQELADARKTARPDDPLVRVLGASDVPRGGIDELSWSPDGKLLAATFPFDGKAVLFDAASLKVVKELWSGKQPPKNLTWSSDGKFLALAQGAGLLVFGSDGTEAVKILAPNVTLAWHPSKSVLAAGGDARLWLIQPDGSKKELQQAPANVSDLAWSPDGSRLLAYSIEAGANQTWLADGTPDKVTAQKGIRAAIWTPDSKSIVFGGTDKSVQFSLGGKEEKTVVGGINQGLFGLKSHPTGRALIAFNKFGMVRVSPLSLVENKEWVATVPPEIRSVQFSPDGRFLAMPNFGREFVYLFDCGDTSFSERLQIPVPQVQAVSWNPKGTEIAVASGYPSSNGVLRVFDTNGKQLRAIRGPLVVPEKEQTAPALLATSGFDQLKREDIAPDELRAAGDKAAAKELVAILGDSRWQTAGPREDCRFSPDGKSLFVVQGQEMQKWDPATGRRTGSIRLPQRLGHFSLDRAATKALYARDQIGIVCDLASGEVRTLQIGGHYGSTLSADGKTAIFLPGSGDIVAYDTGDIKLKWTATMAQGNYRQAAFDPQGKWIATATKENVRFLDAETGKETLTLAGTSFFLAVNTKGDAILVRAGTGTELRDTKTGNLLVRLTGDPIGTQAAFSPDDSTIALPVADGVELWDAATGRRLRKLADSAGFASLSFSPDGKTIAGMDALGTIALWDVADGRVKNAPDNSAGQILEVLASKDGGSLVAASSDRKVLTWDLATRKPALTATVGFRPTRLVIAPSASFAAYTGEPVGPLGLWSLEKNVDARTFVMHGVRPPAAISPDGKHVVCPGHGCYLHGLGEPRVDLMFGRDYSGPASFSPDSKLVAMTGFGYTPGLCLHDVATGTLLLRQGVFSGPVAFHPGGTTVAVCANGVVQLWDLRTLEMTRSFPGYTGTITHLTIRPDGKWLASLDDKGVLLVRDLTRKDDASLAEIDLGDAGKKVNRLTFSPDGRHLITANGNGTLYVLRLSAAK